MSILTLEETKTFLGITTGEHDSTLPLYIGAAEKEAENITNRIISEKDVIEKFSGNSLDFFDLENFPVDFSGDEPYLKIEDETIPTADYTVDSEEGLIVLENGKFTRGNNNCEAKYKAGYTTENIPSDLKLALLNMVSILWNANKTNGGRAIKSETIGDYSVTYDSEKGSVVKKILDYYKIPHV